MPTHIEIKKICYSTTEQCTICNIHKYVTQGKQNSFGESLRCKQTEWVNKDEKNVDLSDLREGNAPKLKNQRITALMENCSRKSGQVSVVYLMCDRFQKVV